MTLVCAGLRRNPQGGLLWKHTGAGCGAVGVNPCQVELIEIIITSAVTSQSPWAAARCLAGNTMWQFGGQPPRMCTHTQAHWQAPRTWASEPTLELSGTSLNTSIYLKMPLSHCSPLRSYRRSRVRVFTSLTEVCVLSIYNEMVWK